MRQVHASENDRLTVSPHVSPQGGYESYRAAYRLLGPQYRDRTFVVLGTSHYGAPERFGLTRKPYVTPWGASRTNTASRRRTHTAGAGFHRNRGLLPRRGAFDRIPGVCFCNRSSARISISCRFCAALMREHLSRREAEANEKVKRFLGALGEIAAREDGNLYLGARHRYGAHGQTLRRRVHGAGQRERDACGRRPRPPAHGRMAAGERGSGNWCRRITTT